MTASGPRPRRRILVALLGAIVSCVSCRHRAAPTQNASTAVLDDERLLRAHQHLTVLDVRAAHAELTAVTAQGLDVALLRARLALAVGDCQGAAAVLSTFGTDASATSTTSTAPSSSEAVHESLPLSELKRVADGCARAMAGAEIASDDAHGVWVRFQNPHDRVLLPLIADVADRAATSIGQHLGTALPRPLRIELVADLPSLAAVTGLPLEAAERTGTIAIARWGKVTMVSPRATPDGFAWQDTLAHELTHLIVTRQSSDAAPLWLQEGIAKREESRWRSSMPLDVRNEAHREARAALVEGRSIGLEQLGASIAFMPTPAAAETAYAEVSDFLDYWLDQNGPAALVLLLRDLAWLSRAPNSSPASTNVERALVSGSGYALRDWIRRWQRSLLDEVERNGGAAVLHDESPSARLSSEAVSRLRLAELFEARRHWLSACEQLKSMADSSKPAATNGATSIPEYGQLAAVAQLMLGDPIAAATYVDNPERLSHLEGSWLAVRGRALSALGRQSDAEIAFQQSLAFSPTLERVACRGFSLAESESISPASVLPEQEPWLSLCRAARAGILENSQ